MTTISKHTFAARMTGVPPIPPVLPMPDPEPIDPGVPPPPDPLFPPAPQEPEPGHPGPVPIPLDALAERS